MSHRERTRPGRGGIAESKAEAALPLQWAHVMRRDAGQAAVPSLRTERTHNAEEQDQVYRTDGGAPTPCARCAWSAAFPEHGAVLSEVVLRISADSPQAPFRSGRISIAAGIRLASLVCRVIVKNAVAVPRRPPHQDFSVSESEQVRGCCGLARGGRHVRRALAAPKKTPALETGIGPRHESLGGVK